MTRIVILGGPKTGKTTLAAKMHTAAMAAWVAQHGPIIDLEGPARMCTDDVMHLGWSPASEAASKWLATTGPWIIEGVAMARALRKWREAHPGSAPPVDRVIRLTTPHVELSKGQAAMAKGEETVWGEIEPWLHADGITIIGCPKCGGQWAECGCGGCATSWGGQ